MIETFADPTQPDCVYEHRHDHDWYEIGARQAPSGVWFSIWACTLCPDIGSGGPVGPVPPGYCWRCHWVQRKWPRKRCEECKAEFDVG